MKHRKKGTIDSQDQGLVRCILSLVSIALMGNVEDKTWVIEICKDYQLQSALWLLDMDNEDNWKDFRSEWLNRCDSKLRQRIAANGEWKSKIISFIKDEYPKGKLNDDVVKKDFQYFA